MDERISIVLEAVERGRAALAQAAKQIEEIQKRGDAAEKANKKQSRTLAELDINWGRVGLAITAATAALVLWVRTSINSADTMRRQAAAIGTTIERLSALRYAADLADIGGENLAQGLTFLSRAMAEASDASSPAARAFRELGISTAGIANRDPVEVMHEIANAFSTTEGQAVKLQIAQVLLGRGSRDMVTFLDQGSEAIQRQGVEAQGLGVIFTRELGDSADAFNDNLTRLKNGLAGVAAQVAIQLLPQLINLTDQLLAFVTRTDTVSNAVAAVVAVFKTAVTVVVVLQAGFMTLVEVMSGVLALAWQTTHRNIATVVTMFNTLVRAVTNIIRAFVDLIRSLGSIGDVFRAVFSGDLVGAASAAKNALSEIGEAGKNVAQEIVTGFVDAGGVIKDHAVGVVGDIEAVVQDTAGNIQAIGQQARDTLKSLDAERQTITTTERATGAGPGGGGRQLRPIGGPDTSAAAGIDQFIKGLNGLENKAQLTANVLQGTLGTAIRGISDGIYGLITGTASWGQVFMQVGAQVLQTLIQIGVEMLAQFILRQTLGAALQTTAAAEGASIAASYAPAAATAGAATFGIGTVIGVALTVAAIVAALASLAFAEGGIVPGTPSHSDNRIAQVASGELILSTAATQALIREHGRGVVGALLSGSLPGYGASFANSYVPKSGATGFAAGGLVGPSTLGDISANATNFNVSLVDARNRNAEREELAKDASTIIIDRLRKKGNRLQA